MTLRVSETGNLPAKTQKYFKKPIQNTAINIGDKLARKHITVEDNFVTNKITQGRVEQWCADFVNYVYTVANKGRNIFGTDKRGNYLNNSVSELKDWGIKRKRFVQFSGKNSAKGHLSKIAKGDIVIFKSEYTVMTKDGKVTRHASHTGLVKNIKNGYVTTIEGNANTRKRDSKGRYCLVHNYKEGRNGNQDIGDFQEVNKADGVIEKRYSVQDLIDNGYSGYINMQKIK